MTRKRSARPISFGGAGAAGVESRGGRGGGVGAAQDHSGGGVADGVQARRTEGAEQGGGGVRLGSSGGSGEGGREASVRGIGGVGGGVEMVHLPLVRHKYDDSNGAPHLGAPLVITSPTGEGIFDLTLSPSEHTH